jgi:hypothetical protein
MGGESLRQSEEGTAWMMLNGRLVEVKKNFLAPMQTRRNSGPRGHNAFKKNGNGPNWAPLQPRQCGRIASDCVAVAMVMVLMGGIPRGLLRLPRMREQAPSTNADNRKKAAVG